MGSASSTYRPKCIYLDVDGRIQKVLVLFSRKAASPAAAAAAGCACWVSSFCEASETRGSKPLLKGRGGLQQLLLLDTDFNLKGMGLLAACEHPMLPVLAAYAGVSQRCRTPLREQPPDVFAKFCWRRGVPRALSPATAAGEHGAVLGLPTSGLVGRVLSLWEVIGRAGAGCCCAAAVPWGPTALVKPVVKCRWMLIKSWTPVSLPGLLSHGSQHRGNGRGKCVLAEGESSHRRAESPPLLSWETPPCFCKSVLFFFFLTAVPWPRTECLL